LRLIDRIVARSLWGEIPRLGKYVLREKLELNHQKMSLNMLVSAAVERTGDIGLDNASVDEKKKRKRVKTDNFPSAGGSQSNPPSRKASPIQDDEEDKQRKRRAQIAEASRRSRARRKKEFQDFKEENDQLWSQNMLLRKTLQDLGVEVPVPPIPRIDRGSSTPGGGASHNGSSDDEDDEGNPSGCPSPGISLASSPLNQQTIQQAAAAAATVGPASQQHPQMHLVHIAQSPDTTDSTLPDSATTSPSGFQEFCQFFERRLSWYFTQLKSDAIRSFASQLPYEEKQKIANLQVKLVLVEGVSPTATPMIALSTLAARQASATSAEQAVDQDKAVRL
jgi:hypothetical protein